MVHKGQEPLVCSPLWLVSIAVAVQCRVYTALVQPTGTALDPRLGASPVEMLFFISANPKAVGVASCSVEQPGIVAGELDPLLTVLGSIGQSTDFLPGGIPVLDGPQKGPVHAGTCHSSGP